MTSSCLSLKMDLNFTSGIALASKDWHDIITQKVEVYLKMLKQPELKSIGCCHLAVFFSLSLGQEIKQEHISTVQAIH